MSIYLKIGLQWLLLATVYYFAARIGLHLAFEQANTSPVWPPTGLAIAAILIIGFRAWPGILAGAFLVNLTTDVSHAVAFSIAIGNTLEAVAAGYLINRFAGHYPFSTVRGVVRFVVMVVIATTISASIGVTSLMLGGIAEWPVFQLLWSTWWLGDLVGALVITPLIVTWVRLPGFSFSLYKSVELLVLATVSFGCSVLVFSDISFVGPSNYPLAFLFIPLSIWTATRFRSYGATLFVVVLTVIAIYGTLQGNGPFARVSINESLLLLQGFMAVIVLTTLALAASTDERQKAGTQLCEAQLQLERRVEQRTEELNKSNLALEAEIAERDHTAAALQALLAATALSTDKEFFQSCVKDLAKTYDARYAFVGIFADKSRHSIRTVAVWADDCIADNFVYELEGTPCEDVLSLDMELVPQNVTGHFPDDEMLVEMGVESYFGAPLVSPSNTVTGIVAVMDTRPMDPQDWVKPVLGIIANRMALELERNSAEKELILAAGVFNEGAEAIMVTDQQASILRVNPAFSRITGYSGNEVIGQSSGLLKSEKHDAGFYESMWDELLHNSVWQGEIWNQHKNGEIFPAWTTITAVHNQAGEIIQYISIFSDITERKISEERINRLAHFDLLTDLPNRAAFHDQLESDLLLAQRHGDRVALIFLDLDHFKLINDASGHAVGDELLVEVATRLRDLIRQDDMVARLGGDEFTVLLSGIDSSKAAAIVADKILQTISKPYTLEHTEVVVTSSIGISMYPNDGQDASTLLKNADAAMYRAKEQGRNNFQFFTAEMNTRAQERLSLESDMRKALGRGEFSLYYQPKVNIQTGEVVGCEALARWQHPEKGFISPGVFIPVAEESGLIVPLGEWVMNTACAQQKQWTDAGLKPVQMAVNLSGRQFMQHDLVQLMQKVIQQTGINPQYLELELTESMLMKNVKETIETLYALRTMDMMLSIDDFGTGYSSMAYLKRFPINKLKIDQSFVQGLPTDTDDVAIVTATIAMGHNLNMTIVAEGVETVEQLQFLKDNGCDEMQGYYFCRPLPVDEITELLQSGRCLQIADDCAMT